ncbi:MAG: hypothetical protein ACRBDI_03970 [Alphaproteobacteria bacterium]
MSAGVDERRMSALYRFPIQVDGYDYRAICLFFACLVYALFGSPTPDRFTMVEGAVGALLCLAVGIGRARDAVIDGGVSGVMRQRFWKSAGHVYLIYGLSVPVMVGALSGNDASVMARDIVPFLFLFLPLLLLPLIRARPYYFRAILVAVLIIGMMFSFRSIIMRFMDGCAVWCIDELLYLENMPTVLFTALFLIGTGMSVLMRGINVRRVLVFVGLGVLSMIPVISMVVTLQRASLGAVAIYIAALMLFFIWKRPVRGFGVVAIFFAALAVIGISLGGVYAPLWDKTHKVGLNMRVEEFLAVWNVITVHPFTFLFGLGWGGQFHSPAVGGLRVNFTHNFFSTVLLKTGVLGVIFCISYIVGLLERLSRVVLVNKVFGLALVAPILIDLTLYASFKSLDFGLMLLLISASLIYFRQSNFSTSYG